MVEGLEVHICLLSINRPELCRAAVSSLMIHVAYCLSNTYDGCQIYAIESKQINTRHGLHGAGGGMIACFSSRSVGQSLNGNRNRQAEEHIR